MMNIMSVPSRFQFLLAIQLLLITPALLARSVDIPLKLQQGFMERLLAEQVYTETNGEARVWDDGKNCNSLVLSAPELDLQNGQVHTKTAAYAKIGTALGDLCVSLIDWNGYIEVFQQPLLGATPGIIEFQVVDSKIFKEDGESQGIIGTVWDWIKKYVHPRFNRLHLNLQPLLEEMKGLLQLVFPLESEDSRRILETVTFTSVHAADDHIELGIRFETPLAAESAVDETPEPALTAEELAHWDQTWQQWDAFLTLIIKQAGADTELHALRTALFAIFLDARQDLIEVLTPPVAGAPDPVPELFVKTWEHLAPELQRVSENLPTQSVLQYLSFMAAGDALAAIQQSGEQTGFRLSGDALRRMARMIAPLSTRDPLHYDTMVDPELRTLFGFGPPLPAPAITQPPLAPEEPLPELPSPSSEINQQQFMSLPAYMLMFVPAMATPQDPYTVLVNRLNGIVPSIKVLNEYLPQMQLLLDLVAQGTLKEKKLDDEFSDLYRPLVLATAWQESCWRQYIKVKGKVTTIRSHAGAVGIMQVNQHVWRGLYDLDGLKYNVGYNAEAGSEILHHYLKDYAIAKGEHTLDGGKDNLVRATYGMYNGGPRHINRYRREKVSSALREIDESFWDKFQAIRAGNTMAVAQCYTG